MGNIPLRNISVGNIVLIHKQPSTHSPGFSPDVEFIDKHYRAVAPHYGNIKLVRDKNTSETMLLKEIFVNTNEAFEKELRFFNNRIALKHPNVVDIIGFTSEESKNFCSNYFKVSVFFEVPERNLQTDLEQRIRDKNFYSENELFLIADNLTSALSYFQNQGHAHGDIRPFNIFVKGYTYKLSDPSLNPQKLSNGLSLAIVEGAKTLLAPELLEQVPQSLFEIKTDIHKADVFSLGATLLGLGTLTNAEDMYDYKTGKINTNILEERLETLKYRYSVVAYDLIKSMLTMSVNERPDFFVFTNRLLPYQEEIRSFRPLPFASSKLTPYQPVHIDTQIHQYDTGSHHHYEEIVKKKGPTGMETHTYTHDYEVNPQSGTNVPLNDVLDTQIKAAIDRTEENLKILRDKESAPYTTPITSTYENYTPYLSAGGSGTGYAADPLSYITQSPYPNDLTMKYLADEKENTFKASFDYGFSSTQPSYRPTAISSYADVNQRPGGELYSTPSGLQTNPAGLGAIQQEGLLGSFLVQELSSDLEQLTQKLEGEGIMSASRKRVVIDPEVASKAVIYASGTLAGEQEGQKESSLSSDQEILQKKTEQDIQIQEGEIQKGLQNEAQSGQVDTLPDRSVQQTREVRQESRRRQEGRLETIDRSGEQERPFDIPEIPI